MSGSVGKGTARVETSRGHRSSSSSRPSLMVAVSRQRVIGTARQQSWCATVNDLFAAREMDFRESRDFVGEVAYARVGELDFSHVISSGELGRRTARHIDRDSHDKFILFTVR